MNWLAARLIFFSNWMYKQIGGGRDAINNADGTFDSLTFYFNQFVSLKSWQKIFPFFFFLSNADWRRASGALLAERARRQNERWPLLFHSRKAMLISQSDVDKAHTRVPYTPNREKKTKKKQQKKTLIEPIYSLFDVASRNCACGSVWIERAPLLKSAGSRSRRRSH